MTLMLYINAIKLFHIHPGGYSFNAFQAHTASSVSPDSQGQHIVHRTHCAICDFQLVKDADVVAVGLDIPLIRQVDVYRAACLHAYLPVYYISTSGRAPPATV